MSVFKGICMVKMFSFSFVVLMSALLRIGVSAFLLQWPCARLRKEKITLNRFIWFCVFSLGLGISSWRVEGELFRYIREGSHMGSVSRMILCLCIFFLRTGLSALLLQCSCARLTKAKIASRNFIWFWILSLGLGSLFWK